LSMLKEKLKGSLEVRACKSANTEIRENKPRENNVV
jgi:hypothetical protein